MKRVAIIGAGVMRLAAGYHALKAGHQVVVYEADKIPGGMAAHFDFGGLSLERFYHFVCKADRPTFELMEELGLGDRMRWVRTRMGVFTGGRLHECGDPIALLKFPGLSPIEKLRYGLMMFMATRRQTAGALERLSAKDWIESWCGPRVYDAMWRPLFDLKFYEFADNISAAWLWTRIKRMAIPGFVEFSRLRPTGDTIVFVPYYMPTSSARWAQRNDELIDEAFGYLKRVNP